MPFLGCISGLGLVTRYTVIRRINISAEGIWVRILPPALPAWVEKAKKISTKTQHNIDCSRLIQNAKNLPDIECPEA